MSGGSWNIWAEFYPIRSGTGNSLGVPITLLSMPQSNPQISLGKSTWAWAFRWRKYICSCGKTVKNPTYDSLTMLELTICKKIVTEMFLSQTHLLRSLHYFAALLREIPVGSAVCCVPCAVWVVLTVKWRVGVWAPLPQTSRGERISNQQPGKIGILSICALRSRREETSVGFWFSTINMSRVVCVQNRKDKILANPEGGGEGRTADPTGLLLQRGLYFS